MERPSMTASSIRAVVGSKYCSSVVRLLAIQAFVMSSETAWSPASAAARSYEPELCAPQSAR
jgi:hypothetical protein